MKKSLLLLLLLLTLTLTACGIPFTEVEQEDEGSPADLEAFFSLEEFAAAIETRGDGVAQLGTLKAYYVPQSIPAEYGLGKIVAGVADILFAYYPVEALGDEEAMMAAEATRKCFEFRFHRWESDDPLSGIMEQLDMGAWDYIDGKYLFDAPRSTYYWAQDGAALSMTLPAALTVTIEEGIAYCQAESLVVHTGE